MSSPPRIGVASPASVLGLRRGALGGAAAGSASGRLLRSAVAGLAGSPAGPDRAWRLPWGRVSPRSLPEAVRLSRQRSLPERWQQSGPGRSALACSALSSCARRQCRLALSCTFLFYVG